MMTTSARPTLGDAGNRQKNIRAPETMAMVVALRLRRKRLGLSSSSVVISREMFIVPPCSVVPWNKLALRRSASVSLPASAAVRACSKTWARLAWHATSDAIGKTQAPLFKHFDTPIRGR